MTGDVEAILTTYRTWAVVGCSPSPWRASHEVAAFLLHRGLRVIPVNPAAAGSEIHGQPVFASLEEAAREAGPIEVVDVFRRSEGAGRHVGEAIAVGARAVWMQLGVVDEEAAARARAAGLRAVMDRCPKIEWPRLTRRSPAFPG